MSLPNIKISGYYGMRNYGDDLFENEDDPLREDVSSEG